MSLCGFVQIVRVVVDRVGDKASLDMLVNTVGRQQKDIAFFDLERPVIDFNLRINSQRAAEVALLRRNDDPMIVGQLLERIAG